jgi:hypothetical protein
VTIYMNIIKSSNLNMLLNKGNNKITGHKT